MNEELNIYEVVRYFIEKSGMLFFYTKEDIKIAYNRISAIYNADKKYKNIDVKDDLQQLEQYYQFFTTNFDEYSQIEENKKLFIDIMKYDSSIMFCGNSASLKKYVFEKEKKLKELNSELPFFQRKKSIRNEMSGLRKIIAEIQDYKLFYEVNVPINKIDEVLGYLQLNSFSSVDDIASAYNKLLNQEYNSIINSTFNMQVLMSKDKQFNYFKDVISCAYPNINLELSLLDKYFMSDIALNRAFNYFKLNPNCDEKEMVEAVSSVIDEIMSIGSTTYRDSVVVSKRDVFVNDNIKNMNNRGNNVDLELILEIANFYKKVLYKNFGVSEKAVVTPAVKKKNTSLNHEHSDDSMSFDTLFNGLSYDEAQELFYRLMNKLLATSDENKKKDMSNLERYWALIRDDLYKKENGSFNSRPRK